jgi:hypothetical protein
MKRKSVVYQSSIITHVALGTTTDLIHAQIFAAARKPHTNATDYCEGHIKQ